MGLKLYRRLLRLLVIFLLLPLWCNDRVWPWLWPKRWWSCKWKCLNTAQDICERNIVTLLLTWPSMWNPINKLTQWSHWAIPKWLLNNQEIILTNRVIRLLYIIIICLLLMLSRQILDTFIMLIYTILYHGRIIW